MVQALDRQLENVFHEIAVFVYYSMFISKAPDTIKKVRSRGLPLAGGMLCMPHSTYMRNKPSEAGCRDRSCENVLAGGNDLIVIRSM